MTASIHRLRPPHGGSSVMPPKSEEIHHSIAVQIGVGAVVAFVFVGLCAWSIVAYGLDLMIGPSKEEKR